MNILQVLFEIPAGAESERDDVAPLDAEAGDTDAATVTLNLLAKEMDADGLPPWNVRIEPLKVFLVHCGLEWLSSL